MFSDFDGAPDRRPNNPNIETILQGALRSLARLAGDSSSGRSSTQCLMMAGEHPVIGGLVLRDGGPRSLVIIDPGLPGEWTSTTETTPTCSYLVQQANVLPVPADGDERAVLPKERHTSIMEDRRSPACAGMTALWKRRACAGLKARSTTGRCPASYDCSAANEKPRPRRKHG